PGGAPVAVSAAVKFCIAPAIATETAPASVRWSGSQIPDRALPDSRIEPPARVSHERAAVWYTSVVVRGRIVAPSSRTGGAAGAFGRVWVFGWSLGYSIRA